MQRIFTGLAAAALGLLLAPEDAAAQAGAGLVHSVLRAPVVPDGDVVEGPTAFVINLAVDMDPAVKGLALPPGTQIRVDLPEAFTYWDRGRFPVRDMYSAEDCVPGLLRCSTAVLLQGWPQNPILPRTRADAPPAYSLAYDRVAKSFTFTIERDLGGLPAPGPGLKQIQFLLLGFQNPQWPGAYPIRVTVIDPDGRARKAGVGTFRIRAEAAPSLNPASVFVPGDLAGGEPPNPNTIHQTTTVGAEAPYPWDFLVWGEAGLPLSGLTFRADGPDDGRIMQGTREVGRYVISAPQGATGHGITGGASTTLSTTPVLGESLFRTVPAGRVTARFTAGSEPGRYFTTLSLEGGNAVTMVVDATAE